MLTILGALLLALVVDLAVIGPVRHARDQRVAFAQLRGDLANATAMVDQTDDSGHLHPLGTPMAVLTVPQIGLREVVFEGTTSGVLMSGPGHRRDTPLPGQAGPSVLMGRQAAFDGPFRYLDQLTKGSVIRLVTGQGDDIAYRVTDVRRAGDPQPPALAPGRGRITLVTASGEPYLPTGVLRVDADLVGVPKQAGPRPLTAATLPVPERVLQGDPGAWVLIVLWGQLLVAAALGVAWARVRWGRWQAWLTGTPLLGALGIAVADNVIRLLPNLL